MDESQAVSSVEEIRLLAEELTRCCARHGVGLTGFAFSMDPALFMHFSTVHEEGLELAKLHAGLCEMASDGRPTIRRQLSVTGDA